MLCFPSFLGFFNRGVIPALVGWGVRGPCLGGNYGAASCPGNEADCPISKGEGNGTCVALTSLCARSATRPQRRFAAARSPPGGGPNPRCPTRLRSARREAALCRRRAGSARGGAWRSERAPVPYPREAAAWRCSRPRWSPPGSSRAAAEMCRWTRRGRERWPSRCSIKRRRRRSACRDGRRCTS